MRYWGKSSLQVLLSIALHFKAADTVVSFPSNITGETPKTLDSDNRQATDDLGDLLIHRKAQEFNASCKWVAQHDTSGNVNVSYEARPSSKGAATDLTYDQGGLIGSRFAFIPSHPGDGSFAQLLTGILLEPQRV